MKSNRKLTNYFIYPTFQFTLIISNVIVSVISMFIIHYKMIEFFEKLKQVGERANLPLSNPYFEFISYSKEIMLTNLNWALGFSVFLSTAVSVYLSHKAVGPIYRLKTFFIQINNGENKGEVNFRKGDYFSDLPAIINSAISKLKAK